MGFGVWPDLALAAAGLVLAFALIGFDLRDDWRRRREAATSVLPDHDAESTVREVVVPATLVEESDGDGIR